jgi:hypothetical protein
VTVSELIARLQECAPNAEVQYAAIDLPGVVADVRMVESNGEKVLSS